MKFLLSYDIAIARLLFTKMLISKATNRKLRLVLTDINRIYIKGNEKHQLEMYVNQSKRFSSRAREKF